MLYKTVIVAVISLISLCPMSFAGSDELLRQDIQVVFDKIAANYDMKDAESIIASLMPDAIFEYADGTTIDIVGWLQKAQDEFEDVVSIKSQFVVESAYGSEDAATVEYTETHSYTLNSDQGHDYFSTSRWRAELVNTVDGWKINSFKGLSQELTRDGQKAAENFVAL